MEDKSKLTTQVGIQGKEGTTKLKEDIQKNTRQWLLITFTHAEKREQVSREEILARIQKTFTCIGIVISKETHEEEGYHYHAGVWNKDASSKTMCKKVREAFPEWEGMSIDIKAHKSFITVCNYIIKEDKEPLIWGEYSLEIIKMLIEKQNQKKKQGNLLSQGEILKRISHMKDIYGIYEDEITKQKALTFLPRMKEAFEDLKVFKEIKQTVCERILKYLEIKGNPREYEIEELKEKYLLIDWIACQLCFGRPIKTKQLFIYGEPSTQKTLIINMLAKVLNIYFASSRKNDFTGAHDYYNLWVFDEFHEPDEASSLIGATVDGTAFANTMLKVLDGQECRLDSKYSRVFTKKTNVPIILIANKLPGTMRKHGPFRARFYRMRFLSNIQNLEEERVIATLWGCMRRRIINSPFTWEDPTPTDVLLDYNQAEGITFKIPTEKEEEGVLKEMYCSKEGQIAEGFVESPKGGEWGEKYKHSKKQKESMIFVLEKPEIAAKEKRIPGTRKEGLPRISLFNFAIIPLAKKRKETEQEHQEHENEEGNTFQFVEEKEKIKEENEKRKREEDSIILNEGAALNYTCTKLQLFRENNEKAVIRIYRTNEEPLDDYATWPLETDRLFELEIEKEEREIDFGDNRNRIPAFLVKDQNEHSTINQLTFRGILHKKCTLLNEKEPEKRRFFLANNAEEARWNIED